MERKNGKGERSDMIGGKTGKKNCSEKKAKIKRGKGVVNRRGKRGKRNSL